MTKQQKKKNEEMIWFKDLNGFFRDDRLGKFLPEAHTSLAAQLNAIMRFALYYGAFTFVFGRSFAAIYIPAVVAGVTYCIWTADASSRESMRPPANTVRDRHTGKVCTRPTLNNPFMNVLMSDYNDNADRPRACDITDRDIGAQTNALYDHNLYKDSDDIFERNTGVRQFYANPSTTIPNDQGGFVKWLYGTPPTCKEGDGDRCAQLIHKILPGT